MPRDRSPCSVAISYALGAGSNADHALQNAIDFTIGSLFVHISVGANLTSRTQSTVSRLSRVYLNPRHLVVVKNSPGPLAAHLANFKFCDSSGMPCALGTARHFVLMASNQVLIRHGLEEWVLRHSLSFCIHQREDETGVRACADMNLFETNAPPAAWWERMGWHGTTSHIWHEKSTARSQEDRAAAPRSATIRAQASLQVQPPLRAGGDRGHSRRPAGRRLEPNEPRAADFSPLYRRTLQMVQAANDSFPAADPYFAMYTQLLREGRAGEAWARAPLNMMSHEGSFYPVAVLRDFVHRALPRTPFADAFASQQHGAA